MLEEAATLVTATKQRAQDRLTRAHVLLLERESIALEDHERFNLVSTHFRALQMWHDQHTGWRILRGTAVIRLVRALDMAPSGYSYDYIREPRDFACLVRILWYAENRHMTGRSNDQQFLLSHLADQIQDQSAQSIDDVWVRHLPDQHNHSERAGKPLDFRNIQDRYSIQRALHYLQNLGGLQVLDGRTDDWTQQQGDADVLYEFTPTVRTLVAALDTERITRMLDHLCTSNSTGPACLPAPIGQAAPELMRAWRALLAGPALFRFDDPLAFTALVANANHIVNEIAETFGWYCAITSDYACIIRGSGMGQGPITVLNVTSAIDQISLLLCAAIRHAVNDGNLLPPDCFGCLRMQTDDLTALFFQVREQYGDQWGKEARRQQSTSLLSDVYKKMRGAGFLRGPEPDGTILITPLVARYAVTYAIEGDFA